MADRVYPSAKPLPNNGGLNATGAAAASTFPATKSQLYGAARPAYRPSALRKRSRRSLCRACCCWTTLILLVLLLLAAAAASAVLYLIYRPHRPSFAVTGFKISSLNLTSNSRLIAAININVTARNPNKKLIYIYNPTAISISTQKNDILIGAGSVPGFVHPTKNTTLLKAAVSRNSNQELDDVSAGQLRSELKSKNGLNLKIELETKVKLKMDGLKTPKVGIRVTCDGIKGNAPTGKTATSASLSKAKCKVDLRIKIWKWTF